MAPVSPDLLALLGATPKDVAAARAAALRPDVSKETGPKDTHPQAMAQQQALAEVLGAASGVDENASGESGFDFATAMSDAMARQQAMARSLRAKRAAGNLGLLTGDSVLSKFGQAQLDQAQNGDPTSLRYLSLIQAQQRLAQQAASEERQGRQGDARLGLAERQYGLARLLGFGGLDLRQQALEQEYELERIKAARRRQEQLDSDVKAFGTEIATGGAPEFYERVDVAKDIFKKYPKDLPGFGAGGFVPDRVLDAVLSPKQAEDARRLRQSVGQALASYQKFITGAGASDAERENLTRITGLLQSGNEQSVRLGIQQLEAAMDASVRARAAAHTPDAVKAYGERAPRIGAVLSAPETPPADTKQTPATVEPRPNQIRRVPMPPGELGQPTKSEPDTTVTLHWVTGGSTKTPAARAAKLAKEQPEKFSLEPFPPEKVRRKKYSKSQNKTYTLDGNGNVISVEEGNTGGK